MRTMTMQDDYMGTTTVQDDRGAYGATRASVMSMRELGNFVHCFTNMF